MRQGVEQKAWKRSYDSLRKSIRELSFDLAIEYLKTIRSYEELNRPLLGKYRLRPGKILLERHLAAAFYPSYGFGYGRSLFIVKQQFKGLFLSL